VNRTACRKSDDQCLLKWPNPRRLASPHHQAIAGFKFLRRHSDHAAWCAEAHDHAALAQISIRPITRLPHVRDAPNADAMAYPSSRVVLLQLLSTPSHSSSAPGGCWDHCIAIHPAEHVARGAWPLRRRAARPSDRSVVVGVGIVEVPAVPSSSDRRNRVEPFATLRWRGNNWLLLSCSPRRICTLGLARGGQTLRRHHRPCNMPASTMRARNCPAWWPARRRMRGESFSTPWSAPAGDAPIRRAGD